eukprot:TRINITY_DN1663_c0_g1_i6.p1 TRINITY_DN1663_c0_g1~~TRINITY_DN1663_c0_g1_i6.p1  ORF type:complete len:313 (-),score=40.48 TRINITY_DN1663_c0_g1_i6:422-1297(-)
MAQLTVLRYFTPHQSTQSENGRVPTRTHYVVKNSSFNLELAVRNVDKSDKKKGDFPLTSSNLSARLILEDEDNRQPLPEEPLSILCRPTKDGTVIVETKLNVLSSQFSNGLLRILLEATSPEGKTYQVTTEGLRCVSKVSQLKRKATPLEAPSAKRTRCDELLVTLQEFQKVQVSQLQSLQALQYQQFQHLSQPQSFGQGKLQSMEEAFMSFVQSYKATSPTDREKRMRAIKENITPETSASILEILSIFGNQSEFASCTSDDSESFEGRDHHLPWFSASSDSSTYLSNTE